VSLLSLLVENTGYPHDKFGQLFVRDFVSLFPVVFIQGLADFGEPMRTLHEHESFASCLGNFHGLEVGFGHVSHVHQGDGDVGQGWHLLHHNLLHNFSGCELGSVKIWAKDEAGIDSD